MSRTFSAAPARHGTYEKLWCAWKDKPASQTQQHKDSQLHTPLKPPHTSSILALAQAGVSPTGSTSNNGLWRQMASAWEDSWRLSGSFSHLKHEV